MPPSKSKSKSKSKTKWPARLPTIIPYRRYTTPELGWLHPLLFALYDDGTSRFSEMPETVLICVLTPYLCVHSKLRATPYAGIIDQSIELVSSSMQAKVDLDPDQPVEFIMVNDAGQLVCKGPTHTLPPHSTGRSHNPQVAYEQAVAQAARTPNFWPPMARFRYIPTSTHYYPMVARTEKSISFYNIATDQYYRLWFQERALMPITAQDLRDLHANKRVADYWDDLSKYHEGAVWFGRHPELNFGDHIHFVTSCVVDGRGSLVTAHSETITGTPQFAVVVWHQHARPQLLYTTAEHVCMARLGITERGDVVLWSRHCEYRQARRCVTAELRLFKIGLRLKQRKLK